MITLDGKTYPAAYFRTASRADFAERSIFHGELYDFLALWFDETHEVIPCYTSGSTGQPKRWLAKKQQMRYSAALTCDYFKLQPQNKVLLSLPLSYIAAKMMVVRAIVGGLNLVLIEPSANPLLSLTHPVDFAAFVPNQVYEILSNPTSQLMYQAIKQVIIGGSAISRELEQQLAMLPNENYMTYGMTETLSHIALRNIKRSDHYYTPLPSVQLSSNSQGCLVIDAPQLSEHLIETCDRVCFNAQGEFQVMGRLDNVVNSAGIKIQIEPIELQLQTVLSQRIALLGYPDAKFGEVLLLVTESLAGLPQALQHLAPWQRPKKVLQLPQIPSTTSGKIDRQRLKKQIVASQIQTL